MIKGIDVANFFIELFNAQPEGNITNLQVNKLVFFAQAWSLVLKNKPLFKEDFRAWEYGPVLPSVYNKFKDYGKHYIERTTDDYNYEVFSGDEQSLLLDVFREYKKYSTNQLVELTHVEGGAWDQIYNKENKKRKNAIIPKELIKEFYSKQPKLYEWQPNIKEENIVGYINEDGITVLPADWDDDGDYWDEEAKKYGLI